MKLQNFEFKNYLNHYLKRSDLFLGNLKFYYTKSNILIKKNSFRLPHLNISTPSDELDKNSQRAWLSENLSHWNGYNHFRSGLNWFRTNKRKILRRSGEGEKGRCLPWSKEEEGAYIFWMKQVSVVWCIVSETLFSIFYKIFVKFRNSKKNVLKIVLIIVNINKDEHKSLIHFYERINLKWVIYFHLYWYYHFDCFLSGHMIILRSHDQRTPDYFLGVDRDWIV
jgi:hypothetical protein